METILNLRHPAPIGDSLFLATASVHLFGVPCTLAFKAPMSCYP